MTTQMFIILLTAYSAISGLIVEAIKKLINDKANLSYNLLAIIVSLVLGVGGTLTYYQLSGVPFTVNNVIYSVLLGLASGVGSMVGYDKVKQLIQQLTHEL